MLLRIIPVSYTHLDVYKRQGYSSFCKNSFLVSKCFFMLCFYELHDFFINFLLGICGTGKRRIAAKILVGHGFPVSYTHLKNMGTSCPSFRNSATTSTYTSVSYTHLVFPILLFSRFLLSPRPFSPPFFAMSG